MKLKNREEKKPHIILSLESTAVNTLVYLFPIFSVIFLFCLHNTVIPLHCFIKRARWGIKKTPKDIKPKHLISVFQNKARFKILQIPSRKLLEICLSKGSGIPQHVRNLLAMGFLSWDLLKVLSSLDLLHNPEHRSGDDHRIFHHSDPSLCL